MKTIIDNQVKAYNQGIKENKLFIWVDSVEGNTLWNNQTSYYQNYGSSASAVKSFDYNNYSTIKTNKSMIPRAISFDSGYIDWIWSNNGMSYGYFMFSKKAVEDVFFYAKQMITLVMIGTAFAAGVISFALAITGVGLAAVPYIGLAFVSAETLFALSLWFLDTIEYQCFKGRSFQLHIIHTGDDGKRLIIPYFYPVMI